MFVLNNLNLLKLICLKLNLFVLLIYIQFIPLCPIKRTRYENKIILYNKEMFLDD